MARFGKWRPTALLQQQFDGRGNVYSPAICACIVGAANAITSASNQKMSGPGLLLSLYLAPQNKYFNAS